MNCKPGDLAIVVNCEFHENIGRLVQVLWGASMSGRHEGKPGWLIQSEGRPLRCHLNAGGTGLREQTRALDENLRPIRPSEGDDETLALAGKPEQVAA